jgi:hypothetical protein
LHGRVALDSTEARPVFAKFHAYPITVMRTPVQVMQLSAIVENGAGALRMARRAGAAASD